MGHDDKIQAVKFLNVELEEDYIKASFTAEKYPIYTPFAMEDAALKVTKEVMKAPRTQ